MANSTEDFWPAVLDVEEILEEKNRESADLFLPAIVYTSVLMTLGTIGNSLTLIVYMKHLVKPSTKRLFILVLASCDFISCTILLPALIAENYFSYTFTAYRVCKGIRYLLYFAPYSSIFTLLLISLERYRKICHPFNWQITLSLAKKLLCVLTVILPAIFATPAAIFSGFSTINTGVGNITGADCHNADEFKHTPFPLIYGVFLLLTATISSVVLIVIYSLIWKATWRHIRFDIQEDPNKGINAENILTVSQNLDMPSRHDNGELNMKKVTRIMFGVTLVFILSFVPTCVVQILNAVVPDFFNKLNHFEKILYQLLLRSFIISYSVNPVVYGFMDMAYRKACKKVFRCKH